MGDKGRIVVPAEVRERHGWRAGTVLVAVESDDGDVVLVEQQELLERVRKRLAGPSLVDELVDERRREAARDAS